MNNCFIILAAGESKRFNSNIPKSYQVYKGKPVIYHSIDKALKCEKIRKIVVVTNKKHNKFLRKIKNSKIKYIYGGTTRAISSLIALKSIKRENFKNVLIHDAARPNFSIKLVNKIIKELKKNNCVVPAIKPNDTVKLKIKKSYLNLDRENLFLSQTPQGFNYKELEKIQNEKKIDITDDSTLFLDANKKIKIINGELNNIKITFKNDIEAIKNIFYGIGFDVHRLALNRKLYLGGLKIKSKFGTVGHSDGDPVLHSIIDSILGACKMGDIGEKFSDKSAKFKNIRSSILLKEVIHKVKSKKFFINNIDINIITQKPKISKYKDKIIKSIGKICDIPVSKINIKGKTAEKLGVIGKEKAIACEVITSVIKYD